MHEPFPMKPAVRRPTSVLRPRGFTAVEVLIAMTIMAIGAAGVISMQRASVQGNLDARKADIANSIARTWVERLQRDAAQWTQPGPANPGGNNLATAQVIAAGIAKQNTWFAPDQYWAAPQGFSPGFDILGRDVAPTNANPIFNPIFCANVRLNWLSAAQDLIRADVRVLWARAIVSNSALGPCDPIVVQNDTPDPTVYHAIYVTTAIKGNPF